MGTWSAEPFGNDTACDWAGELVESGDLSYIEMALDKVLEQGDAYVDAPDAEEAIAAVEVVAKLFGRGTQADTYTMNVDAWVKRMKHKPAVGLREKAQRVIDRVLSADSELSALWQESDQATAWDAAMGKLRAAVNAT